MKLVKSPGAMAARGASEIDQLGGTVDRENSLRSLIAQPLRLRAGNATKCLVCSYPLKPKRASRRQKYCSYRCRDESRRARNFEAFATTRRASPQIPRSTENNAHKSTSYKGHFGDRPLPVIEVLGHGRKWRGSVPPEIMVAIRNAVARELGKSVR